MTSATTELDAFCQAHGIPVDRARLVSRNLVLVEHARQCHNIIEAIYIAHHETFNHDKTLDTCDRPACIHAVEMLAKLRKAIR